MSQQSDNPSWFQNPWLNFTGLATSVIAVLGMGFYAGHYKMELQCQLDKIHFEQEANEKLLKAVTDCDNSKVVEFKKTMDDVVKVVDEIRKQKVYDRKK